jgi:superfamily II DNA or RNA helicase
MAAIAKPKPRPLPVLRVTLRRRWANFECEPEDYGRLDALFSYRHPRADFIPSVRFGEWDGMIHLMRYSRIAVGLFRDRRADIEKMFRVELTEELAPHLKFRRKADPSLRPYQKKAVKAMMEASDVGGIILSATGSGKTKLAGSYFKRLIGTGVFVVDELALLEQARQEISRAMDGEPVGVVGKSIFDPQRITVATTQTLNKHRRRRDFRAWFRAIDAMIIDELHVQVNRRNFLTVAKILPRAVFGLTATLQLRKPEVELPAKALCGPVIFTYPIKKGVEEGYLCKGRIFIVPFHDPLKGMAPGYWSVFQGKRIFIEAGSPMAEYRRHICKNKARNSLVEKLVRANPERRTIVLVERRLHLQILSKRLADLPHAALSGNVNPSTRFKAMGRMDSGELNLILATRVFAKGVDIKTVDCIIDATGKPSRNNVLQRYGRGVRQAVGKKELLFYDIADRGSGFTDAAWARFRALQETGAPIYRLPNSSASVLAAAKAGKLKLNPAAPRGEAPKRGQLREYSSATPPASSGGVGSRLRSGHKAWA